ncbi:MAG: hypothetical protein KGM95_09170, partial [Betaproteobacteria bacterium]|nr:hypothetical protein [Betaproteobacteria bacterium]
RWSAWIGHMANLDAQARTLELRNLNRIRPAAGRSGGSLRDELNGCRDRLAAAELIHPQQHARLRAAVRVPDDYVTWWRVLGLYPLTAPIVEARISVWHNDTHATFATPLATLPVEGSLERWAAIPAASAVSPGKRLTARQMSEILRRSRDPLGIPLPANTDLHQIFDAFSPVWEVDVADDNDRIGKPRWENARNGPVVDITHPTLYRKVSHTRFGGQVLLQLNYIVWFPARPGNDIYAGQLDGINWRVTLGPDGEPWLYDVIHNCGCYHKFFPSRRLRLRSDLPAVYFEPPLLPQPAPEGPERTPRPGPREPLVLRIAHRTHFIQRLYHDETQSAPAQMARPAQPMAWEEYDALRSLPAGGEYHDLFGAHGLIAGTERTERFFLWPMGIRSPGAMRQWGHHATAFVGRRHFDDAFLLESLFEKVP